MVWKCLFTVTFNISKFIFFQIFSISTSNLTAIDPDVLALLSSSYSKILEEKLHYAYFSKGIFLITFVARILFIQFCFSVWLILSPAEAFSQFLYILKLPPYFFLKSLLMFSANTVVFQCHVFFLFIPAPTPEYWAIICSPVWIPY